MEDKKCSTCACGGMQAGCGHYGNNLMGLGGHNHLIRGLLYLIVLVFVFWVGLGLGELKGYLRYAPFDSGYSMYPPQWILRQNNQNKSLGTTGTPPSYDTNILPSPEPHAR